MVDIRRIEVSKQVDGHVSPPGSKSLTQRYMNLALIASRDLMLERPLLSEDTEHFAAALEKCGFSVRLQLDHFEVGRPEAPCSGAEIDCGAGGTMFRFLTAAMTTVEGSWRLDGISRLRERPIGPLVSALRQLGADIESDGFAPVLIRGGQLPGGLAILDAGASSQFLSALLMAALRGDSDSTIRLQGEVVSAPYVDLTLQAIEEFGGVVERTSAGEFHVPAGQSLEPPASIRVEGDYSSAAYPAAAAAIAGGCVEIDDLRSNSAQGDRGFLDVLAEMGAKIRWQSSGVQVSAGPLTAVDVDLSMMPDQVPTLAAIAPFARGTTVIRNVAHLRIKESDRLRAMRLELERVGVPVVELDDGLRIEGCWADRQPPGDSVEVETHGDHRIAMSLAVLGLRRPGIKIRDPEVVAKSYPRFWADFEALY